MSGEAPSLGGAAGSAEQPRLRWLREFWGSTLGKKIIVATTGLLLALYVILHAFGNLKALQGLGEGGGQPAIDEYGEFLREAGGPVVPEEGLLWALRAILLLAFVVHVVGVTQLIRRNRAARPDGNPPVIRRTLASRTMALSGFLLLAFIVFHVLQFTTLTIEPTPLESGEVYANLYNAFQETWLMLLYVGMMGVLFLHLRHALWSLVQTAGWDKPNRNATFRRGATVTAVAVSVGFALVPIMFYVGAMPEPPGVGT